MAKHYRKSRRHHKGKHSRKTHRKQQQRKQKQQRGGSGCAYQRGGSGCAYQAQNRQAFQMGGMAPFVAGDAYLLDAATRVQAEVGPLDNSFGELPSVIPHRGGARRSRRHRQRQRSSSSSSRKQRHQRRSRKQRGGMADFEAPYTTGVAHQAQNAQFQTEGTVNPLYHETKGPQGF